MDQTWNIIDRHYSLDPEDDFRSVSPGRSQYELEIVLLITIIIIFIAKKSLAATKQLKLIKSRSNTRTAKSAGKVTSENYPWLLMRALYAISKPI